MAKSFFERLTGSVRVNEEGVEKGSPRSKRVAPSQTQKAREETLEIEGKSAVIHPVATEAEVSEEETAGPEPEEEGQLTVDIYDEGPSIVIQSTVAGVRPEDVDISLQEETLTIRGSRRRDQEVKEDNFYYRELYWGAFSRSIILPEEVDFQKASAVIKNGLLTVKLPKKDKGEKKIKVKFD